MRTGIKAGTSSAPLTAALTLAGISTLMPDNQYAETKIVISIDELVREFGQWMDFAPIRSRCANVRMLLSREAWAGEGP